MLKIEMKRKNLFEVSSEYCFAHCISSDCNFDEGIATQFQKKFSLKSKLLKFSASDLKHPTCIKVDKVYNLITKSKYNAKPTYESVKIALLKMKEQAVVGGIKKIAMPKIASNLDRLSWAKVKEIIMDVFKDTDIEILVCFM